MTYQYLSMAGRCRNGAERDSGSLFHAVEDGKFSAICGAIPGRKSAGWSSFVGKEATCPRCVKKINKTK